MASAQPPRPRVGPQALAALQRDMVRVPLSLAEVLDGRVPMLPALPRQAPGYLVTSLPEDRRAAMGFGADTMIAVTRQRYTRHWVDLSAGFSDYWQRLGDELRRAVTRNTARIASVSGGTIALRRFRTPHELAHFHDMAHRLSLRTYRQRLGGDAIPDDSAFLQRMMADATAGLARGWVLHIAGEPAAFLYATIDAGTVVRQYAACDPAFADFDPEGVLQVEIMRDLFGERSPTRFDFAEGAQCRKGPCAIGGVACLDLLLLRPSLAHHVAAVALTAVDRATALGRHGATRLGIDRIARIMRDAPGLH
ncbi:GNAT family N-acetyltransferase [Sphingomonas sp. AR_OL41]|uniref:GNAT family N-acetyltransferase n=1 Tax=Sphingomonas sp. AR_OL41 TaxID=3042729 RepID=UPI00247FF2E0|nr:GNAT family N-acetyltransferase [Sphingomonas sp. AR_OL41]MDH7973088.1 GNAT family N-acetyltransferase [Sphingomonas sp. AR_OL41]